MPLGTIYLLTNPAMPGLVKIGITFQDDVQTRMTQLYTTGVPVPFECAYAALVEDPAKVEQALHNAFSPHRLNPKREFFQIEVGQALGIIKLLEKDNTTSKVNEQKSEISEVEREAGERLRSRRPNLNFVEMGIPLGSEINSTVTGETAEVMSPRTVRFRGEEQYLTAATQLMLGNEYAVAPAPYWTFNGESLHDMYNRTYLLEN
jgi:hypothetical protein